MSMWYWSVKVLFGSGFLSAASVLNPGQYPWPGLVGQEGLSLRILFSVTPIQVLWWFKL